MSSERVADSEYWQDYALVRQSARNFLGRIGVFSNPGWTDQDILNAIREKLGLEPVKEYVEWQEPNPRQKFEDGVKEILDDTIDISVEESATVADVALKLDGLMQ